MPFVSFQSKDGKGRARFTLRSEPAVPPVWLQKRVEKSVQSRHHSRRRRALDRTLRNMFRGEFESRVLFFSSLVYLVWISDLCCESLLETFLIPMKLLFEYEKKKKHFYMYNLKSEPSWDRKFLHAIWIIFNCWQYKVNKFNIGSRQLHFIRWYISFFVLDFRHVHENVLPYQDTERNILFWSGVRWVIYLCPTCSRRWSQQTTF